MLTDERIRAFQTLWRNRFGEELSKEEVYEKSAKLVRLVELIYRPMSEDEYQQLQERRQKIKDL